MPRLKNNVNHSVYVDLYNKDVVFSPKYRMSDFHLWLIAECIDIIRKSKTFLRLGGYVEVVAVKDYNIDNRLPDIYTPFFDVECETGLKSGYKDLIARINLTRKMVIVVVANDKIKDRYVKHVQVRKEMLKICTLGEFKGAVRNALRSYELSFVHEYGNRRKHIELREK